MSLDIDYEELDEYARKERREKSRFNLGLIELHKRRLQLEGVPNEALEDLFSHEINQGYFLREILFSLALNEEGTLVQRARLLA